MFYSAFFIAIDLGCHVVRATGYSKESTKTERRHQNPAAAVFFSLQKSLALSSSHVTEEPSNGKKRVEPKNLGARVAFALLQSSSSSRRFLFKKKKK